MRAIIISKLNDIERAENISILHAVESGSRAWGFASPDSDYDVRFFYMRPKEYYLRLDRTRDVIEYPITDVLDINGWDIDKTLKLLHASNPTLFEWSNSPIIYKTTDLFKRLLPRIDSCFVAKSGLWHYLSMAEGNYREYLKGEMVKAKKYFYVIRPLLACRWILERQTSPPMLFTELVESQLEPELKPVVGNLLRLKMSEPEIGEVPRITPLNDFIERNLGLLRAQISALPPARKNDWQPLNSIFLSMLEC
ncbi:MAG: nucleotidyltransferase domain-containing protein [Christensenellales bacterium]|jgi:predicted nucleotidyltransferase